MSTVHKFTAYDDIEYHLRENEVLSELTETLSFAGNTVELDLNPQTVKEALTMPLGQLLEMGRPVGRPLKRRITQPDMKPGKRRSGEERKKYIAGLVTFARARGLDLPPEPVLLRHVKVKVLAQYDAWLATQVR